jgi:hypothetical protein
MDLAESATYLRHHLSLIGRTDPLLADDASLGCTKQALFAAGAQQCRHCRSDRHGKCRKGLVDDDRAKKAVAEVTRD